MANFATILLAGVAISAAAVAPRLLAQNRSSFYTPGAASIPRFSSKVADSPPVEWHVQAIRGAKRATVYRYVRDDEVNATVLEGSADAAASAITYRFDDDAHVHSILRFKWRPGNLIATSDPLSKAGDDYTARIYVTFVSDPSRASIREKTENAIAHALYGETPPHAALSYVYTHKAAAGTIITSPYTHRVKNIVVDSDPASLGKWKSFTRDIYEDYKRAFGEEPTRISGIAIMVDTDNTGEKTSARFGDITLTARP